MVETLQVLLGQVIDYAGMYPPAKLPLSDALRNYIKYKSGREAWITSRFICPVTKISELEAGLKWHSFSDRFGVCVTSRGGDTVAEFLASTLADTKSARKMDRIFFDAFETRLPADTLGSAELGHVILRITRSLEDETDLFLEVPFADNWQVNVPRAIETLSKNPRCKAKIRTGGTEPAHFPSVEQVALFISECAQHKIPFKATAGLHHPIRKLDDEVGVHMHGFLNVFVAAAIAHNFGASPSELVHVLSIDDPSGFRCLGTRISVGNWHLSIKQLRAARNFALSYGSCSVTEPLTDLAHLGHSMRAFV
ncbi:MAG: hypothetical protein M3R13_02620 [Armatimonadota bacterium]|nr:hypothetical protein [Armatimonadota bacterium]